MRNKQSTDKAVPRDKKTPQCLETMFKHRYILLIILLSIFSISHTIYWNQTFNLHDLTNDFNQFSFNHVAISYRPKLILHIGPPKTGTTSIQCGLARLSGTLAHMDNYYYIGSPCAHKGDIYNINNQTGSPPIRPIYDLYQYVDVARNPPASTMDFFEQHHRQNHSLILSAEKFSSLKDSERHLSNLRNIFPAHKWDVQIIVTYRRYYEWIPSMYHQTSVGAKRFREDIHSIQDYVRQRWDEGKNNQNEISTATTKATATATASTITTKTTQVESLENIILKEHPTIRNVLTYQKKFPVILFNCHQSNDNDDLVTNFICHAVPEAHHTCNFIRASNMTYAKKHESHNADRYVLAREAHERGLLKEDLDPTSMRVIETKFNALYGDGNHSISPPQICLSKEQEHFLWNISLASEEYIMTAIQKSLFPSLLWGDKNGTFHDNEMKKQHLEGFDAYKKNGKLCSLDLNQLLSSKEWIDVFQVIQNFDIDFLKWMFLK